MSDDYQNADAPIQPDKKKLPPLTDEQIAYAHELLEEIHPLEKTPVREAFQWLGMITCYKKPKEKATDDEYLRQTEVVGEKKKTVFINGKEIVKKWKRKIKNPLSEKTKYERPVAQLGFGIVAYLDMLWSLIWTFALYSLILIPTFSFYSHGGAYDSVPEKLQSTYLHTYMCNLGYSHVQCTTIPQPVGKIKLNCPYGTIGQIYDYGVDQGQENKYQCINNKENEGCKPNMDFVE